MWIRVAKFEHGALIRAGLGMMSRRWPDQVRSEQCALAVQLLDAPIAALCYHRNAPRCFDPSAPRVARLERFAPLAISATQSVAGCRRFANNTTTDREGTSAHNTMISAQAMV
jgi:hypothetical protein